MNDQPPYPATSGEPHAKWKVAGVCLGLAALVWLVFGQTVWHEFVNVDDGVYVFQNALITRGLTLPALGWFFTHTYCDYWAPLLAASHMLDCQFYGVRAGGHHLVNVLFFGATVILLFLFLRRTTKASWLSAFAVAAFAVHPLRVESVAWVTERKDMLSGLFFVLTLTAYVHYVRGPRSRLHFLAVVALFACGLMSKPSVVTLPFALLLLDYWPLRRFEVGGTKAWLGLVAEKIPLFALAAVMCVITILTGKQTLVTVEKAPLATRLGNAVLSYVAYLGDTFYPVRLAAYYPYPEHLPPFWKIGLALTLLASITAVAIAWRRTHPWLTVGWFWYLGMLAPMIGVVQAGEQGRADRHTYLPHIGLLVAITWTAWHLCAPLRRRGWLLGGAGLAALAALAACARQQTTYWRDSESLWRHALACTSGNNFAHNNLGAVLLESGQLEEAARHFQAAIDIQPHHVQALYNLGNVFSQQGRLDEAMACYQKTLMIRPDHFEALNNLGSLLLAKQQSADAVAAFRRALAVQPASADVRCNLGNAMAQQGRFGEAIIQFEKAIEIHPGHAKYLDGLASALLRSNRVDEAVARYRAVLALQPDYPNARSDLATGLLLQGHVEEAVVNWQQSLAAEAPGASTLNNLAWVLATGPASVRHGRRAVELAEQAARLTGNTDPMMLRTAAAAYAEAGRFPDACETAHQALDLAIAHNNTVLSAKIEQEKKQYESGVPHRDNL